MTTAKKMMMLAGLFSIGFPYMNMASAAAPVHEGYLVDSAGLIVRSGFGVCWHTGYWSASMAVAECDPVAIRTPPVIKTEAKPSPPVTAAQPSMRPPTPKITPPTEINLSDTAHFTFDESALKPEDKAALDKLVHELGGASYEAIYVTGHAGRIGTAEYNMELSLRRAYAVQSYLESKGIPADRIKTEGKGETEPVTKDSDCRGMTSARAIACLRLDRRTEITVVGTKGAESNKK